jgi:membrane-bound lytic murein transglycosylase D
LADLYDSFDDWFLAWSGYNTGAGRVQSAINAQDSRDYWELIAHDRLHPETANYVPKILAAAILGKNLEAYGFEVSSPQAPLAFDLVEITGSVSVDIIAECAGVDTQAIEDLNGALLRGATPPHSTTRVYLPAGTEDTFLAAYESLPDASRASYHRHTVESGESLGAIAAQYEIPASLLAEFNRIENPHLIRVGMSLVVPVPGMAGELGDVASVAPTLSEVTVGPGDSLLGIADRLGVGVDQLVAWNQIDNPNRIQVGQRLLVPTTASAQAQGVAEYEVRGGDTLYGIALEQGCTVAEIKRWNGLGSSTIHPGQALRVRAP